MVCVCDPDYDKMIKKFETLASEIKSQGIKAVKLAEFDVPKSYTRKYQKWLNERRKRLKK